jgi:hypothetical protein
VAGVLLVKVEVAAEEASNLTVTIVVHESFDSSGYRFAAGIAEVLDTGGGYLNPAKAFSQQETLLLSDLFKSRVCGSVGEAGNPRCS